MNEIMRPNDKDDLSNRSMNNKLGSKLNINNKNKMKKKKKK